MSRVFERILVKELTFYLKKFSLLPQGSVIVSLLFLICINDLVDSIDDDININIFADDTKLYLISNNINNIFKLQRAIDQF